MSKRKYTDAVIKFAAGNYKLHDYFADYYQHYLAKQEKDSKREFVTIAEDGKPISFAEKEVSMNKMFFADIMRRTGVDFERDYGGSFEALATNPMVGHHTYAVVSSMIDMILPNSIVETTGLYADSRVIGWGDNAAFVVKPNDLFYVSKTGHAQRRGEIQTQSSGMVTITPEWHDVTVGTQLYKVLAGIDSLAEFTAKAVRSIETSMTLEVYTAFDTAMSALSSTATTGLQIAGYSQANITRLCEQVTAWNQGSKAVIVGTRQALVNILPNDANYRYSLSDPYATLGYVPSAFGYDIMMLPQVADLTTKHGLALSNSHIWIVSPSSQKIVKLVLEGSMLSNTTQPFDNADLSQTTTLRKSWGVGVATNAVAGLLTI
jgi:hypothetical protein